MISAVYFERDGRNIMVAAFMLRSDAKSFIDKTPFSDHYKIADVGDCWADWSKIRDRIE